MKTITCEDVPMISSREPPSVPDRTRGPQEMTCELDEAVRELVADYAGLQAAHQRLIASPYDRDNEEAHEQRLYEHFRRATLVLEQLRHRFRALGVVVKRRLSEPL
jgi:molybdenum-dependent DNA-binding transcriptional regulator ModE